MKKWEIYWAEVQFEDVPQSKKRPVLILDDQGVLVLGLKLTSHKPRDGEYGLKKWKESGLTKPTTVRVSKKLRLSQTDIKGKIGKLHPVDIAKLQTKLQEKP